MLVPSYQAFPAQAISPPAVVFSGRPFNLAVNEWWQVPRVGNSHLADAYSPLGAVTTMSAWGGATVDTLRKELDVFGQGHGDGADNAMYAFGINPLDANFLLWRRKVSSSPTVANDDSEQNADGSPAARHTYDGMFYHAGLDKIFISVGGFLAGPGGVASDTPWGLDAATENPDSSLASAWTRYDDGLSAIIGTPRASIAYDPVTGKYFTQYSTGFASFDPTQGTGSQWVELTESEGPNTANNTAAVAPLSPSQMVWVNTADGGEIWSRNLTSPYAYIGSELTGIGATGDINILDVTNPGMEWEPNLSKMVLWGGLATGGTDRRDTYQLDMSAKTVTRVGGTGDIPDAPQANGTFGRFAYLGGCGAQYSGLWILVNATTSDVYFFRSS